MPGMTVPAELRDHPDRLRWNARYRDGVPTFDPHPLVDAALAAGFPAGPVLELACGASGSALALAAAGREVVAVDVSDVALEQLATEARRRTLSDRVRCVLADVPSYEPGSSRFALVLATLFWDPAAYRAAAEAVMPGGLLAWEALGRSRDRDDAHPQWRVADGELRARLPGSFEVVTEELHAEGTRRSFRILARRTPAR